MSRRNQTRRRRTYGRRQHEVRERRLPDETTLESAPDLDGGMVDGWMSSDADDAAGYGRMYEGFAR